MDWERAVNAYESALRHNPYSVIALSHIASLCRGREQFGKVNYYKLGVFLTRFFYRLWNILKESWLYMKIMVKHGVH